MTDGRLLILDDDPGVGRVIEYMAASMGLTHRAVTAPDTFFAQLDSWEPDYILLDLLMPEMDGVQILQHLAERSCGAAIIISSGADDRIRDAARRAAQESNLFVAGSLSKPFTVAQLRGIINGIDAARPVPRRQPPSGEAPVTEADLQRAIEKNQIELAYQPKIACTGGTLVGFEALARWRHPDRGIIMPDQFIPLSEASGLIDPLTRLVVRQGLEWITGAVRRGQVDSLSLAINLSAKSLAVSDLADRIAADCGEFSFPPERLTLELTETAAMEDPALALGMLTRLRIKGFGLSIDDFGTGYSSMMQLSRLPFSEIKADKSFVMSSSRSSESRAIVKATVDLGRSLGLRTVAEGVEDIGTLDYLRQIGCDVVQGYYIARPMRAETAAQWIAGWSGWTAPDLRMPSAMSL